MTNPDKVAEISNNLPDAGLKIYPSSSDGVTPTKVLHILETAAGTTLSSKEAEAYKQHLPAHANVVAVGREKAVDVVIACSKHGGAGEKCGNMKETLRGIIVILSQQRLPLRVRVVVLVDKPALVQAWKVKVVDWCKTLAKNGKKGGATLRIAYVQVEKGGGRVEYGKMSKNLLK
jgi:hypothetical protein